VDTAEDPDTVAFPGAQLPERTWRLDAGGVGLAVSEWGPAHAPVLLLIHGGFDFAATFDVFAPKLAALGWRVVSWDQRGHGDSDHTELYGLEADLRDALSVIDAVADGPVPVVGHSKGGMMSLQIAAAQPWRFSHIVNLDGVPCKRRAPDIAEHDRTTLMAADIEAWLDHRRHAALAVRRADTLTGLAHRRGRINPRLAPEWLAYLVTRGARRDADGWRWKLDPSMRFGGFGPWRPEWTMACLPGISVPLCAVLVSETEEMGWGTQPEEISAWMPPEGRIEYVEGSGHFVHIEQPDAMVELVADVVGPA
jgi:pimeloyl-ACP methyl ester carboxylesterase